MQIPPKPNVITHSEECTEVLLPLKCRAWPYLMQDGCDEHVSKQPLVVDGVGMGVRGVGKPERLGNRGALGVGLVEGGVEVRQQLVAHA